MYPSFRPRSDIIVITDEAHRSQYDIFAVNMRTALPNAAFIGFTGTPLIAGEEERTREVFGDYISIYNFTQSMPMGRLSRSITKAVFPSCNSPMKSWRDEIARVIDDAKLSEEEEDALARRFAKQYQLITNDDRLEKIAADLVRHFSGRGYAARRCSSPSTKRPRSACMTRFAAIGAKCSRGRRSGSRRSQMRSNARPCKRSSTG